MSKREDTWQGVSIRTRSAVLGRHAVYHVDDCAALDDRLSNSVCVIALPHKTSGRLLVGLRMYESRKCTKTKLQIQNVAAEYGTLPTLLLHTNTHIEEHGLNSTQNRKRVG
ncbi:hypothetical protein Pyn_12278 [Prunus yedoensis var. nudiflora]|uniref:Uncharacterized protein n=1 Tax=Prunus yedoensis var. nudiflora TaxID=2094558 RepID=A0A314UTG9_PRUYE|nr:hypothetical protein Pyn_12278 [Prunus yedoensis var. nudiflora]